MTMIALSHSRAVPIYVNAETWLGDTSLTIALTVFTNTFSRINDATFDFPPVKEA